MNNQEKGWGIYSFPETIGREKRVEARIRKQKQIIENNL